MTGDRFRVDLDQLDDVVTHLARQHVRLDALAGRLAAEASRLHAGWDGAAADAHVVAQARWDQGFSAMREALAAMRAAADTARANYAAAADANVSMWRQLR